MLARSAAGALELPSDAAALERLIVASRKEERERLREYRKEKEAEARSKDRRRLMVAWGIAGLFGAVVLAGIVALIVGSSGGGGGSLSHINQESGSTNGVSPDSRQGTSVPAVKVSDLQTAAKQAGCKLRLGLKDEGHEHIPPESKTPPYETNPPTSGPHVEPPYQQADGAYSEMPEEIDIVHSLEHGRMEIQYSPTLSERDQLQLKGLYETLYAGTLLFPNDKMPYEVAATTWTNLIGCPTYKGSITLDAIRDFGEETWGKYGGEPPEAFPFTGPTPANPSQ